jgi:predicted nucleotidyltransferase
MKSIKKRFAPHEGYDMAKELLMTLKAKNIPVRDIYLFGSVAKGESLITHDIDILVVTEPFQQSVCEENSMIFHEGAAIHDAIEAIAMRTDVFDGPFSSLAREVKHYGIRVKE